jgi:hypothetical protein
MEPDSPDYLGDLVAGVFQPPRAASRTPARALTTEEMQALVAAMPRGPSATDRYPPPGPSFQQPNARSRDPERQARYDAMINDLQAMADARRRQAETEATALDAASVEELLRIQRTFLGQPTTMPRRNTVDAVEHITALLQDVGVNCSQDQVCKALDSVTDKHPARVVATFLTTLLVSILGGDADELTEPEERTRIIALSTD